MNIHFYPPRNYNRSNRFDLGDFFEKKNGAKIQMWQETDSSKPFSSTRLWKSVALKHTKIAIRFGHILFRRIWSRWIFLGPWVCLAAPKFDPSKRKNMATWVQNLFHIEGRLLPPKPPCFWSFCWSFQKAEQIHLNLIFYLASNTKYRRECY